MNTNKQDEYKPPTDLWEVDALIDFNEPISDTDPRYVATEKGRGDFSLNTLLKKLGVNPETAELRKPKKRPYIFFCGHTGCGKSSELLRLANYLHGENLFFVVFLDCRKELDHNNLHYPDVMLALATKLMARLEEHNLEVDEVFIRNLRDWFQQKIYSNQKLKDFSLEIETGAEISANIPFLAKLFAKLISKVKTGASYKEEIRREVVNTYTDFAASFNTLIKAVESMIHKAGLGKKVLFIVDGTDRLSKEDSRRLFIDDVHQLQQIDANFIYCGPIPLLYEGNRVQNDFKHFILPMIKIRRKDSNKQFSDGYNVLRRIIFRRADEKLFENRKVVNDIIKYSGGSPRILLKLLQYAIEESDMKQVRQGDVNKAVKTLETEYQRFLRPEDYEVLYKVDQREIKDGSSEQLRRLLFDLAILEYNSFWWRSHPVVKNLEGYKKVSDESTAK